MDRLLLKWVLEVPDLQVRAPRDGAAVQADVVRRYADLLLDGVEFPPVLVMRVAAGLPQVMVLDGRHRLAAHRLAGREDIAVEYSEAKDIKAGLEVALRANGAHGLPRSREDLRHCIGLADKLWPEVSDREIARRLGCGHSWVSEVRRKAASVLAVECPVPDTEAPTSKLHEGFEAQVVIGVDHGAEPPAQVVAVQQQPDPQWIMLEPRFAAQTVTPNVEDAEGYAPTVLEPRPAEAAWVEDVDQELAGMGTGRVLLASWEAEVPVAREVKRHRGQDPLERWYTDVGLAAMCWRWLLRMGKLPIRADGVLRILEPCVGGGAWIMGLEAALLQEGRRDVHPFWIVCDVDMEADGLKMARKRGGVGLRCSFEDLDEGMIGGVAHVAITNPPNSRSIEVAEKCFELVAPDGMLALLMPASFMAAQRRREWLKVWTPRDVAYAPWRPSFGGPAAELQGTGEGSPTQDYALHVWRQGDPPGDSWRGTWISDFDKTGEVEDGEE